MSELCKLTINQAAQLLRQRRLSSVELTSACLQRIEQVDGKVRACVTICPDIALEQAQEADRLIKNGERVDPLAGIPVLIKDNICTKGIKTTCSSKMLQDFVPPYDATVIRHLKARNTVILGKTNMDEFAMGSSTENSAFFPTRNPWALDRVPGGSSGGSAAAVAADEAIYALGSDTGGSIRQPAGFCNVVGLKPTYGRVSRFGLVAFASSLDQIGPITKDVTDCALVLNAIAGNDPKDSTTAPYPVPDYTKALVPDLKNMRLGVPREYFVEGMQSEVRATLETAIRKLEELGARVDTDVSLPHTRYALAVYYIVAPSEASANLARYDGVKYGYSYQEADNMWEAMEKTKQNGFGAEVKRRIMLGTYALSAGYYEAYYGQAQKIRTLIIEDFNRAFEKFDLLVSPTAPSVPFKLGEKVDDPLKMYLSDICTIPVNLAGLPAISLPAGLSDGLPVGFQIIGPAFSEPHILQLAALAEKVFAFKATPPL